MVASASYNKFYTRKNLMAYTIFPSENDEGRYLVPKPPMSKERISIWKKYVLIPFSIYGKLMAFLGSYPPAKTHIEKAKNFFLCYLVNMPSAFEERSLDFSFMETLACVFWYAPPTQSKEYLAWLNKVKNKKTKIMGRFRHLWYDTNFSNWP